MITINSKKKLIFVIVVTFLALNASLAVLKFYVFTPSIDPEPEPTPVPPAEAEPAPVNTELSDEYYSTLFNYGDAVELCSMEARSRNSNLIQLTVNEHSSRFIASKNNYLVKLDSHVGTPLLYDEKSHTCEIDPITQGVQFYKEVIRRKAVRPE